MPFALVPSLLAFQEAAQANSLDFTAGPEWDAWFRFPGKHQDCLDPAWYRGTPILDFTDRILRNIEAFHRQDPASLLLITWSSIQKALHKLQVPNHRLKVKPFWSPYYAPSGKPALDPWKTRLGDKASLYEILRYFFNHPEENTSFLWYSRRLLLLAKHEDPTGALVGLTDANADVYAVYDPHADWSGKPYMLEDDLHAWPGNVRTWHYSEEDKDVAQPLAG